MSILYHGINEQPLYDRFTHSSKGLKGTQRYIGFISLHVIIQSKLASCNLKSSDYTLQPCLELNLDHLLIEFKLPFLLIKSKLKHFITWAKTGVAQYFGPKLAWINISQLKLSVLDILGQPDAFHDFESKLAPIILS